MKTITEMGKETIKEYKELFGDSDECYVAKDALDKFNEMLHDGKHTFEQAYWWMMMEKNKQDHEFYLKTGMHLCNDYAFLYPEIISSNTLEKNKKDDN